jgi:hypothetical protein
MGSIRNRPLEKLRASFHKRSGVFNEAYSSAPPPETAGAAHTTGTADVADAAHASPMRRPTRARPSGPRSAGRGGRRERIRSDGGFTFNLPNDAFLANLGGLPVGGSSFPAADSTTAGGRSDAGGNAPTGAQPAAQSQPDAAGVAGRLAGGDHSDAHSSAGGPGSGADFHFAVPANPGAINWGFAPGAPSAHAAASPFAEPAAPRALSTTASSDVPPAPQGAAAAPQFVGSPEATASPHVAARRTPAGRGSGRARRGGARGPRPGAGIPPPHLPPVQSGHVSSIPPY